MSLRAIHSSRCLWRARHAMLGREALAEPPSCPCSSENFPDPFVLPHGRNSSLIRPMTAPTCRSRLRPDLVHWAFAADPALAARTSTPCPSSERGRRRVHLGAGSARTRRQVSALLHRERREGGTRSASVWPRPADPLGPFVETRRPSRSSARPSLAAASTPSPSAMPTASSIFTSRTTATGSTRAPRCGEQPLAADGLSVVGQPVELMKDDQSWEAAAWSKRRPWSIRPPAMSCSSPAASFGWNPEKAAFALRHGLCELRRPARPVHQVGR